jgi:hypothetical protein
VGHDVPQFLGHTGDVPGLTHETAVQGEP